MNDFEEQLEQEREKYQQAMMDWADDSLKAFVEIKKLRKALEKINTTLGEIPMGSEIEPINKEVWELCCSIQGTINDALKVGKE